MCVCVCVCIYIYIYIYIYMYVYWRARFVRLMLQCFGVFSEGYSTWTKKMHEARQRIHNRSS